METKSGSSCGVGLERHVHMYNLNEFCERKLEFISMETKIKTISA